MFWLVPIIGAFFGLVAGASFFILNWAIGGFIAAVSALLLVHVLNRFLHIDGLSDLGDGLLSGGGQEKKVAAMKDSRTGAGGVAYVLFFELLYVAALFTLAGEDMALWLFAPFAAEVLAKNALVTCAASGRPAEGLAGIFVRNTTEGAVVPSTALSLLLVLPLGLLLASTWGCCVFKNMTIILSMVLISIVVGYLMARIARRNFGMVNGDVLGATNEIARPMILITMLVVMTCLELAL
jgi:adenosylcobinamide-GDP ribazoletransferase